VSYPGKEDTGQECCEVCILAYAVLVFTVTNLHSLLTESSEPLCNTGAVQMSENVLEMHQHIFFSP